MGNLALATFLGVLNCWGCTMLNSRVSSALFVFFCFVIMTDEVLTTPDEVSELKSKNAAQSDPHPVDGKTQIFQAGYQAGQQAAKSETDAKLSKAIEAAQQQKKKAEAALQQLTEEKTQKKIASAKEAAKVKEVATKQTQEAEKAKKAAEVGKKKAEEIKQKEEKAKAAADLKTKKLAEAKKAKEKADKAVAAAKSKATKKAAAQAKKLADKKLAVEKVKEDSGKKNAKEKKAKAAKAARKARAEKKKATKAAEKARRKKKAARRKKKNAASWSFADLDNAVLGITDCKGKKSFPRSQWLQKAAGRRRRVQKQAEILTVALFRGHPNPYNRKLIRIPSQIPNCNSNAKIGPTKFGNTKSIAKLCPRSTKKPELFRTWRKDKAAGIAPAKHINSWPFLKVAQYCNAFIGRKTDRGKHLTGWGYGKVGYWQS